LIDDLQRGACVLNYINRYSGLFEGSSRGVLLLRKQRRDTKGQNEKNYP
jgi:hypothetical protein